MPPAALPLRHFLLALAVVAIWGSNFVVIKFALHTLPPMLLAVLRFALAVLPAALLLPRPAVPWLNLTNYGLFIGVGQFGLLYLAMRSQISPGLASLVVQTQVFFTLLLAVKLAREPVRLYQWLGLALAAGGLAVIMGHTDGSTTPLGLLMVLGAALSWACGNLVGKRAGSVNMLAYVVWSSAFAVPPLLVLTLWLDGPARIGQALAAAGWDTWAAVGWQAWGNTLFGYGIWSWLLTRHAAARIVPMALLVPVFGMGAASLLLNEPLPAWKLAAAGLVMSGLAINLLWPSLRGWLAGTARGEHA
jgi:O-acetylserine/cysteine efflux transporter